MKRWCILFMVVVFLSPLHIFAAEKTFNAVAAPFPPIVGPSLEHNGWFWKICTAALESQGYTVTLTFLPWARALKEAQHGRYDGLFPTYWTEERTQWFAYSVPVEALRTGFFKRKDRDDIVFTGDLTPMAAYTIGLGRGYSVSDAFDQADYLDKHEVATNVMSLKMLWNKRLDLIVGDELVELYNIDSIDKDPNYTGMKDGIVFLEPPLQKRALYMAISKEAANYEQKLEAFNRGIQHLIDNGVYHNILAGD